MKTQDKRQVVYKRVKAIMPHCNVCEEELRGRNSLANPYKCSCGEWERSWSDLSYVVEKDI